jgi:hypothetical protein
VEVSHTSQKGRSVNLIITDFGQVISGRKPTGEERVKPINAAYLAIVG